MPTNTLTISNEVEACAAVLMACLRADELDSEGENAAFVTTIKSRNIFLGSDPAVLIETAAGFFELAGSSKALIDAAVGALREQTKLPLFYHCLDVILSNGVVTPREHQVFQYLQAKLKVTTEQAFHALEVLTVKNQL